MLDTSTVILLPGLEDPGVLPDEPLITAVTLAELSVGPLLATTANPKDFAGIEGLTVITVPQGT